MAQEYTVSNWQPWETDEGPIRDDHGNYKGSVWFEEDPRQVDATFKNEPKEGDKKYGEIVPYTTKAGKNRIKFQRADRPQEGQPAYSGNSKKEWKSDEEFYGDKDSTIKAEWAIAKAVTVLKDTDLDFEKIEEYADKFFAMVDRVKGSSETTDPKAPAMKNTAQPSTDRTTKTTPGSSGYDKFKASKPEQKSAVQVNDEEAHEAEMRSLVNSLETGTPINLDEIPF